jgi:hypothetical protein
MPLAWRTARLCPSCNAAIEAEARGGGEPRMVNAAGALGAGDRKDEKPVQTKKNETPWELGFASGIPGACICLGRPPGFPVRTRPVSLAALA